MTYLLIAIAAPLAIFVLLGDGQRDAVEQTPKEIPTLWGTAPPTCPQAAEDQARAFGRSKLVLAEGKRERSPFRVQDGVLAVPLFELAAACFKVAHDQDSAAQAAEEALKLRRSLGEDYRAHQVRLEHVLRVDDLRTAQKEVRLLLAMLEGQS